MLVDRKKATAAGAIAIVLAAAVAVATLSSGKPAARASASDYRERAAHSQENVTRAVNRVFLSFNQFTLALALVDAPDAGEITRERQLPRFFARLEDAVAVDRRELEDARTAIVAARAAVRRAAGSAQDRPAGGAPGEIDAAGRLAADQREYFAKVDAFLTDYERLIDFLLVELTVEVRRLRTEARLGAESERAVADGDLDALAAAYERAARRIERLAAAYRSLDVPAAWRVLRNARVRLFAVDVRTGHGIAAAIGTLDMRRIDAHAKTFDRVAARYDRSTYGLIRDVVMRSDLRTQITVLRKLEHELADDLAPDAAAEPQPATGSAWLTTELRTRKFARCDHALFARGTFTVLHRLRGGAVIGFPDGGQRTCLEYEHGDTATATITTPVFEALEVELKREHGAWTVVGITE